MSQTVFAYGSNMCSAKLRACDVSPVEKGQAAMLADHRLVFNKKSTEDGSGNANVIPHEGINVWGVLNAISDSASTSSTTVKADTSGCVFK